ncbi:MAG: hypothetical protein Q7S60_01640 [bacterium]|nr:hypothetical protein [bacterium]
MPFRKTTQEGIVAFVLLFILATVGLIGLVALNPSLRSNLEGSRALNVLAGRESTACENSASRPCYDKKTGGKTLLLSSKNAANPFDACISNSAPNQHGDFVQKTTVCGQEKVTYCHDGKSDVFLRKFTGDCLITPPPSPPPSPSPSPSPTPISGTPFRVVLPNGGEQWPFGSQQVIKWEGGDLAPDWPVYLSIVDGGFTRVLRELVIKTPNDGGEDWIVDLPLGDYIMAAQGCRDGNCTSPTQWDYSNAPFSVASGAPIEKVASSYPTNQSLVALSPSGGETWSIGSAQTLKWSGGMSDWKISISLVDNSSWTTYTSLFRDLLNDGSESWAIPGYVPPGSYLIYISCTNCSSAPAGYTGGYYTYSFNPFSIK